ncbi:MAG: FAD-dependent oxidoreductase [Rhodobacteraceae bacterium]|nr:FAD-dependent oxidoreductase [Paracoccaceae bacterium]
MADAAVSRSRSQRYSAFSLLAGAFRQHRGWRPAWREPPLEQCYDIVIVGAGGHGLATAYYLARHHGSKRRIAVLERGWLGGGNVARNTVTIRSNYLRDESIPFYVKSVALYEGLTKELNFNLMHSRRGMIDVINTWPKLREIRRRRMVMDLHGATYRPISVDEIRRRIPLLTGGGPQSRLPILAGMLHPDAAVNRHDAVAWGYARAAGGLGVAIHQNTEVKSLLCDESGAVCGVETSRGRILAGKTALAVSGHTTSLTDTAGLRLPLRSFNLTAFVSEPVRPVLDCIVNCPDLGVYLSQSDKGEFVIGGAPDPGQSFRRDIRQNVFEDTVCALLELFPSFKRLKLLRQWGGHLDMAHDASPIMSPTERPGLYISAGWWGGYKAIPAGGMTFAHLLATGTPHPLMEKFTLDRFPHLDFIIESGTTAAV